MVVRQVDRFNLFKRFDLFLIFLILYFLHRIEDLAFIEGVIFSQGLASVAFDELFGEAIEESIRPRVNSWVDRLWAS